MMQHMTTYEKDYATLVYVIRKCTYTSVGTGQ
jgi:hypothetical protein